MNSLFSLFGKSYKDIKPMVIYVSIAIWKRSDRLYWLRQKIYGLSSGSRIFENRFRIAPNTYIQKCQKNLLVKICQKDYASRQSLCNHTKNIHKVYKYTKKVTPCYPSEHKKVTFWIIHLINSVIICALIVINSMHRGTLNHDTWKYAQSRNMRKHNS